MSGEELKIIIALGPKLLDSYFLISMGPESYLNVFSDISNIKHYSRFKSRLESLLGFSQNHLKLQILMCHTQASD